MTYREMLEKYKRNELTEGERLQIEADVEKQDAISEYLTERLENEFFFDAEEQERTWKEAGDSGCKRKKSAAGEKEFEAYVRKSIRRSFTKMGLIVCGIILVVVLFVQLGLSPLISHFYYDPGKQIEVSYDGGYSSCIENQMSRDLAVFSEVTLPGKMRNSVQVIPMGYGKYGITLNKTVTYAGTRQYGIGGQIIRGQLMLYDADYLKQPSVNLFACYGLEENSDMTYEEQLEAQKEKGEYTWYYLDLDSGREALENLEDHKIYQAYVTLEQRLDFEETNALIKRMDEKELISGGEIWQGVCVSEDNILQKMLGYFYKEPSDEETMQTHFTSMLQYIADHQQFLQMMGEASGEFMGKEGLKLASLLYTNAIDYVEKNGLTYYGIVCLADKEGMLKMLEDKDILSVVAQECD